MLPLLQMDDREANEANRVSDGTSEELQAIGGAQDQPSNNESAEQRSQLHDAICPLCGNEVDTKKTQSEFAENAASPGVNTSCDGALHLAFVNGMICVANTPESQPQEGENTIRAVERDVKKIPVQSKYLFASL